MAEASKAPAAPAAACSKLPKPLMRGFLVRSLKRGMVFSVAASVLSAWYWKVFHMDYRQRKTQEYYATYDPVKEFERMRDMGMFQWAKPKPGSKPIYDFYTMEPETCGAGEDQEEVHESSGADMNKKGRCLQYEDGTSDAED